MKNQLHPLRPLHLLHPLHSFRKPVLLALLASLSVTCLSGCGFTEAMYDILGGEKTLGKIEEYKEYNGDNGVSLVYDASSWEDPYMIQEDTVSIVTGNTINYTAVMLQVTDSYDDFLTQSGEELQAETTAIAYDYELSVPNAQTECVRYDCGSYQTIFGIITFDDLTVYLTAATYSGDLTAIEGLLQDVYPSGEINEEASALLEK